MDLLDIARYVGALMLVLALVGFAGLAARRYGVPGIAASASKRRLTVVETLMIGPRHKVFLLRRDDREHLILLSPQGASVVESAIAVAEPETLPCPQIAEREHPQAPTSEQSCEAVPC